MRALTRRLTRLEKATEPPVRYATLKDLVLASMGRPFPEGVVWGGPLAKAFDELPRPKGDGCGEA